jgi:hypothetical protein
MGRPIGSVNAEKPVSDLLRLAVLSGGGRRLRVILEKLLDKAEQGDLQAIREMDRLDGKPVQAIELSDVPVDALVGHKRGLCLAHVGGECSAAAANDELSNSRNKRTLTVRAMAAGASSGMAKHELALISHKK